MTQREISETELAALIYACDHTSKASAQLIARAIIQRFRLTPREQPEKADPAALVSRASTR
jgi:hypothetical protein